MISNVYDLGRASLCLRDGNNWEFILKINRDCGFQNFVSILYVFKELYAKN